MWDWLLEELRALWWKIKNTVNNVWSWIVQEANKALTAAKQWATVKVAEAKIFLQNLIAAARAFARTLYEAAIVWARTAVNNARVFLTNLINGVRQFATDLYNAVKQWALDRIEAAKIILRVLIEAAKTFARALFDQVKVWARGIVDAAKILLRGIILAIETVLRALIDQLRTWILEKLQEMGVDIPGFSQMLKSFLDSPVSFILAAVVPYFMALLEWSLAYALGTKERTLPPWPDFVGEGAGGGIYPGEGPPPGASGLAPPLDNIYISGYTYGPGHPGIDLGLSIGTPLYAMHDGEVIYAGWDSRVYGYQVTIKSGEWWSLYGHCSQVLVVPGQRVDQRSRIALGGTSGNSSGPHLHLEIKYEGSYIDPITVL